MNLARSTGAVIVANREPWVERPAIVYQFR